MSSILMSYESPHDESASFVSLSPRQSLKSRKRVTISNGIPETILVEPASSLSEEERMSSWWQKDEYETAKRAAKNRCRELRKEGFYKGCLSDAYKTACRSVSKGPVDVNEINFASVLENQTSSQRLVDWCADSESPRGLERWTSKAHGYMRDKHVGESKTAVMMEQNRQCLLGERDEERLGRVAMNASKSSRAFARLLGQADQAALVAMDSSNPNKRLRSSVTELSRKRQRVVTPDESPVNSEDETESTTVRCLSPIVRRKN